MSETPKKGSGDHSSLVDMAKSAAGRVDFAGHCGGAEDGSEAYCDGSGDTIGTAFKYIPTQQSCPNFSASRRIKLDETPSGGRVGRVRSSIGCALLARVGANRPLGEVFDALLRPGSRNCPIRRDLAGELVKIGDQVRDGMRAWTNGAKNGGRKR